MNKRIYLDYNATCPVRPEVAAVVAQVMQSPHNASSVHRYGQEGRKYVEDARAKVAALVNISPAQVIFNSGATEGNNTVLNHFKGERILVSSVEHPSVLEAATDAERIPVTPDGLIDLQALEKFLQTGLRPALVSVMLVNNETGAIQPIRDVSNLCRKYGALLHCDAVQAAGKIPVDIAALGVDFMTLSAHKIGDRRASVPWYSDYAELRPRFCMAAGRKNRPAPARKMLRVSRALAGLRSWRLKIYPSTENLKRCGLNLRKNYRNYMAKS